MGLRSLGFMSRCCLASLILFILVLNTCPRTFFTKGISSAHLWERLRMLINIYDDKQIKDMCLNPSNDEIVARENWRLPVQDKKQFV